MLESASTHGMIAVSDLDGIADHESGARGAWFKDPDGNILQIGRYGEAQGA